MDGVMRESWVQIGHGGAWRRGDISHTSRELDILCGLARATQVVQNAALDAQFVRPAVAGETYGIVVSLCHDATPKLLVFGRLQQFLMPYARCLVKIERKWYRLRYEEYSANVGKQALKLYSETCVKGLMCYICNIIIMSYM